MSQSESESPLTTGEQWFDSPPVGSEDAVSSLRQVSSSARYGREFHVGRLLTLGLILTFFLLKAGPLPVLVVAGLLLLIVGHEAGHWYTARRTGMKVTEFFVGFGPVIFSVPKGETVYGLKALPFGGYCRIVGMNNLDECSASDEDRAFRNKSVRARVLVASAGSAFHFILAAVLLFIAMSAFGRPDLSSWSIGAVVPGSPAEAAGLAPGDILLAIDGQRVKTFDEATGILRDLPGQSVSLSIAHADGTQQDVAVTLASRHPSDNQRVGFLGIGQDVPMVRQPISSTLREFPSSYGRLFRYSIAGVTTLFSPSNLSGYAHDVVGGSSDNGTVGSSSGSSSTDYERPVSPVGLVRVATQAADSGLLDLMLLFVAVNVFIGMFNLIPLPPFDGGLIAVALYEGIRSRGSRQYRVDYAKLLPIALAVVVLLVALGASALLLDIRNPLSSPY